jgi:hypothetical protein
MYEKIFNALIGLKENKNKSLDEIKLLALQMEDEGWIVDHEGDLMRPNGDAYYGEENDKTDDEDYVFMYMA